MAFISGKFLLFLAVFFLLYFVVPKKFRWIVLLAGSYVFYIVNSKTLTVFLIATTLAAFGAGLWLEHLNSSQKKALAAGRGSLDRAGKKALKRSFQRKKRGVVTLVLLFNFGILGFLKYYNFPRPSAFLSYEREAYFSDSDLNFRVTFDENILCRLENLSLESEIYGEPLLPENTVLMEIKCSGGIPMWMTRVLSEERIYKTSFSKYGEAYRKIIFPKLSKEAEKYA